MNPETPEQQPDIAPQPAAELPPKPAIRWGRWIIVAVILCLLIAGSLFGIQFWNRWHARGPINTSGGLYFAKRVELNVPIFRQNDPRWGQDALGQTDGTLGAEGCAVSSAAMIMAFYGVDTDPQRLNQYLNGHEGYTPQGWIYWEKAAELSPEHVRKAYEDQPSYYLIDRNLMHGNPVIVQLRLPGTMHFVVIAGKDGYDYLTRDPGAGSGRGTYPLKDLTSKIYGLRYYERF